MSQLNLVTAASKVHHLTNLNTYVIEHNQSFIFQKEVVTIPSFMPGAQQTDVIDFQNSMKGQDKRLFSYQNKWGLHYLGYSFSEKEKYAIIIGPYVEHTPNLFALTKQFKLNNAENEVLKRFCEQLHILSTEVMLSYSSILQLFDHMFDQPVTPTPITQHTAQEQHREQYIANDMSNIINLRYKNEANFLHAVGQGDKVKAQQLITSDNVLFSFAERFPNQPIRRVKNFAIILNTLLRIVARNSDVPPILIHHLSESYAIQIETQNQIAELNKLYDDLIEGYCDLIKSHSLSNYSTTVQSVIEHILTFYNKRLDIQQLADDLFLHPSHLSRKFKQETTITITDYQQNIRIKQAQYLLKNSHLQIEEIAWMVGYEDASYFSRVFKRKSNQTPSEYRES